MPLSAATLTLMKRVHVLLLSAAMAVIPVISHAQWQWVDKDGRKVFSDQPPPFDIPEKNVLKSPKAYQNRAASNAATAAAVAASSAGSSNGAPAAAPASAPAPQLARDKELEEKKKLAEDEAAGKVKAQEAANAKARAENCRMAKEAKAQLDSGVRITKVNRATGEREYMDDDTRAAETRKLQASITSDCSPR